MQPVKQNRCCRKTQTCRVSLAIKGAEHFFRHQRNMDLTEIRLHFERHLESLTKMKEWRKRGNKIRRNYFPWLSSVCYSAMQEAHLWSLQTSADKSPVFPAQVLASCAGT